MKKDLDNIIKENRDLKKELYGKNKKIKNINDIVERVSNNKNNNNLNKNNNNQKYKNINFNENLFQKGNYNRFNFLKERSKTPLLNKFNNEEYDLPNRRFNNFRQYFSIRTEPNNDAYNDLNPSFKY